ncbi:hypothetical protein Tco_0752845 [Tanacetum coccineum]|uniref:Uncharacterized protein n=1 Tax=Tanacetum coccineum TaxID=301880 RepID=A0ABQ4Z812_9ASTR
MGIRHAKTLTLRGEAFDKTRENVRLVQVNHLRSPSLSKLSRKDRERGIQFPKSSLKMLSKTWQSRNHPKNSLILSKPDRSILAQSVAPSIRNEDLQTELEYLSEDYDEEREMEPRPRPTRETTPPFQPRSPGVRRQGERVVGFEEAPNREGSRPGRNAEGSRPSKIATRENGNRGMNLPPLLAAHLGRKRSTSTILFDLRIRRPLTYD